VIASVADIAQIQVGEVLVLRSAAAWTPLFAVAGAIVVDLGGPLSQAAITAQELGIPMVSGVFGAIRLLPTGAPIKVSGSAGTVTREG
jgi:phosphohistidine swiveling domain-containing protein